MTTPRPDYVPARGDRVVLVRDDGKRGGLPAGAVGKVVTVGCRSSTSDGWCGVLFRGPGVRVVTWVPNAWLAHLP